jgi:Skp family chaperone for outer membrane proteins
MRAFLISLVTLGLILFSALARADGGDEQSTATEEGDASPAHDVNAKSAANGVLPWKAKDAPLEEKIEQLRDLVQRQAQELESQRSALRRAIGEQQQEIERLRAELELSRSRSAPAAPQHAALMVTPVSAPLNSRSAQASGAEADHSPEQKPASPLFIRIGSADFTPGGWVDFTSILRTTNVGSGIGTSFGSIPFSNTTAGRLTETRFSPQNSRFNLKITAKPGNFNVTGFLETDFVGLQPANVFVTSNSNAPRMRLYWVDVQRGRWEFLGGQSWSFLAPNRNGLSPLPADIFAGLNVDPNLQVGLTWTRAPQFRVVFHPNERWALGVAIENPEQFIGGAVTLPSALTTSYSSQLDNGTLGSTPNVHPDILPKVAFDGHLGDRHLHVEAVGMVRSFKVFNPLSGSTSMSTGAGGSLNLNLEMFKNFHIIANSFWSDGGGRYIFGLGPDLIIRGEGSPSLVHSGSGIGGFEWQATPRNMLYSYYGLGYFQRNVTADPATGKPVGFGYSGSSSSANRAVQEPTFGYVRTLWKHENYGGLQFLTQYSYLSRSPWFAALGTPKNAHASMVYLDFRYLLP